MLRVVGRSFSGKNFGPLDRFAFWADDRMQGVSDKTAKFGERFTAVQMFKSWPMLRSKALLRLLAKRCDYVQRDVPVQEQTKVTDDSVLLFYSDPAAKYIPRIKAFDLFGPVPIFLLSSSWASVPVYSVFLAFYYQLSKFLGGTHVTRMDLIPSMESILFQKVGFFGKVKTELVPIRNLTKLKVENSAYHLIHNYMAGAGVDQDLLFMDWETGQEYGFDRYGTWMDKNLDHPLLNDPDLIK